MQYRFENRKKEHERANDTNGLKSRQKRRTTTEETQKKYGLTTKELNDLQPECHIVHMQELEVAAHRIQVTVWTNEQTLGQIAMVKIVLIETDTSSL